MLLMLLNARRQNAMKLASWNKCCRFDSMQPLCKYLGRLSNGHFSGDFNLRNLYPSHLMQSLRCACFNGVEERTKEERTKKRKQNFAQLQLMNKVQLVSHLTQLCVCYLFKWHSGKKVTMPEKNTFMSFICRISKRFVPYIFLSSHFPYLFAYFLCVCVSPRP